MILLMNYEGMNVRPPSVLWEDCCDFENPDPDNYGNYFSKCCGKEEKSLDEVPFLNKVCKCLYNFFTCSCCNKGSNEDEGQSGSVAKKVGITLICKMVLT